jgi:hypothetical protein
MLQYLVVSAIVVVAAAYAAWSLAPRTLRLRAANRALSWATNSTGCPGWLRARIASTASNLARSACEACGSGSVRKRANADVARKDPH